MRFVLRTLSPVRVAASLSSIKTDPAIFIISADRPLVCAVSCLGRSGVGTGQWALLFTVKHLSKLTLLY